MTATDLRADLSEHLAGDFAELDPDHDPAPVLDNVEHADWALRKLSAVHTQMRQVEALAADEVRRIEAWKAGRLETLEKQAAYWTQTLEAWHRAVVERGGAKTQTLPCGTLRLRAGRAKVEALGDPSDSVPERLVRVSRKWDRTAVAKATTPGPVADDFDAPDGFVAHFAVTTDGEVLGDVVLLVPVADSFSVSTEVVQ